MSEENTYARVKDNTITAACVGWPDMSPEDCLIALQQDEEESGVEWIQVTELWTTDQLGIGWTRESEVSPWEPPMELLQRPKISLQEFVELFTPDEFLAIETLMQTNGIVRQLYKIAEINTEIDMDDPRVDVAFDIFVAGGIMDEDRRTDIMDSLPPAEINIYGP